MKRLCFAVACLAIALAPVVGFAHEDDEYQPSSIAFQGRVGGVYTGGEPFNNGATFEVAALFHLQGPLYLNVFGGIANYDSDGDIIPVTDEFGAFWDDFTDTYRVLSIDDLRYRLNFVGAGGTITLGAGKLEPQISAGVGAYQVKFVTSFSYVDRAVPDEFVDRFTTLLSLEDEKWELGYNIGGGLYYRFNQIINFGGHVTYHMIDTDAIEDLVSFTFGMHIRVP